MKQVFCILLFLFILTSCEGSSYNGRYSDGNPTDLQERVEELESELEEANDKISEYEAKLTNIQSEASNGYNAISNFNMSYQLQEALNAFENIQNKANY